MQLKQLFFSITGLLFFFCSFGQSKKETFLKWKIQSNEIVKYHLISQSLDTPNNSSDTIDLSGFFTSFIDTAQFKLPDGLPDSLRDEFADSLKIMKQKLSDTALMAKAKKNLNKLFKVSANNNDTLIITLKKRNQNIIDIMMNRPNSSNVILRGAVYDSGSIQSFYIQNNQKNLIELCIILRRVFLKVFCRKIRILCTRVRSFCASPCESEVAVYSEYCLPLLL